MLASQWRALGKEPREIFPISFRSLVPVDGRTVSGRIDGVESSEEVETLAAGPAPAMAAKADPALTARPVQARKEIGTTGKRTTRRRKAEMNVEFTQGTFHGTGVTGNVSPRGMFVHSTQIPGAGPTLRLKVNLPEGRTLVLTAKVVRSVKPSPSAKAPGFGVRLAEDSPEYEDLLSRLRHKPK